MGVFIGGIQAERLRLKSCPADTVLGGHRGENWICGEDHGFSCCPQQINSLCGGRGKAAGCLSLIELLGVKGVNIRLVLQRGLSVNLRKDTPESLLIGTGTIVFHHGGSSGPDAVHQLCGIIAKRHQFGRQQLKIGLGKTLLIHRQQRSIQIKKYRFCFHAVLLFLSSLGYPSFILHFKAALAAFRQGMLSERPHESSLIFLVYQIWEKRQVQM